MYQYRCSIVRRGIQRCNAHRIGLFRVGPMGEAEAKRQERYIANDPNPENGMFFRSDHFPYVKKGIPAIFAKGYSDAVKLGPEKTREMIAQYWKTVYHTPQDEYNPQRDDLSGLVEDARLMFSVGLKLANTTAYPGWKEGAGWSR